MVALYWVVDTAEALSARVLLGLRSLWASPRRRTLEQPSRQQPEQQRLAAAGAAAAGRGEKARQLVLLAPAPARAVQARVRQPSSHPAAVAVPQQARLQARQQVNSQQGASAGCRSGGGSRRLQRPQLGRCLLLLLCHGGRQSRSRPARSRPSRPSSR